MSQPLLQAHEVSGGYRGRPVIRRLSFSLQAGELLAVVGPNGAGKSTLLRLLAGTLVPSAGVVRLGERALSELDRVAIARRLAVVPQETEVAFGFSVRDVAMMGRAPHQRGLLLPSDEDRQIVTAALTQCELVELAERSVAELSGGERQRVTIARALVQRPQVLLLDEPAAHLDVRHAWQIFQIVRREIEQRALGCLAVMHDLSSVARWADRVLLLHGGSVQALGTPDEVLTEEHLETAFGTKFSVGTDAQTGRRYFVVAGELQ